MYQQRKFASEDIFVSWPFFGCRFGANFDEMNKMPIEQILGYLMTDEGLLCHRETLTIIVF